VTFEAPRYVTVTTIPEDLSEVEIGTEVFFMLAPITGQHWRGTNSVRVRYHDYLAPERNYRGVYTLSVVVTEGYGALHKIFEVNLYPYMIVDPTSITISDTALQATSTVYGTAVGEHTLYYYAPPGIAVSKEGDLITVTGERPAAGEMPVNTSFDVRVRRDDKKEGEWATLTVNVNLTPLPGDPSAPVITSANNTVAVFNRANTFQVTATGDTPITYELGGTVPAGVSINPTTGLITIAPTTALGTHGFTVIATNAADMYSRNFTLTVRRLGDANGDDLLTSLDVLWIARWLADHDVEICEVVSDITDTGNVEIVDLIFLARRLIGDTKDITYFD
jgi:hypothetical protein